MAIEIMDTVVNSIILNAFVLSTDVEFLPFLNVWNVRQCDN